MTKPKLLVADDSLTVQKVFQLAFESEQVMILVAGDGKTALALAEESLPAMVIADTDMPIMDGFALCRAIKDNPSTSHIPVYMLASSLMEYDLARAQRAGADGKLEKPFRSEEMVRKTLKVIGEAAGDIRTRAEEPRAKVSRPPTVERSLQEELTFEEFGGLEDDLLEEVAEELRAEAEKAEIEFWENEMDIEGKVTPVVKKIVAEMATGGELDSAIEKAVDRALERALSDGRLETAVQKGIDAVAGRVEAKLAGELAKSAREVTLKVAEDVVRKTIDQLRKTGRP